MGRALSYASPATRGGASHTTSCCIDRELAADRVHGGWTTRAHMLMGLISLRHLSKDLRPPCVLNLAFSSLELCSRLQDEPEHDEIISHARSICVLQVALIPLVDKVPSFINFDVQSTMASPPSFRIATARLDMPFCHLNAFPLSSDGDDVFVRSNYPPQRMPPEVICKRTKATKRRGKEDPLNVASRIIHVK